MDICLLWAYLVAEAAAAEAIGRRTQEVAAVVTAHEEGVAMAFFREKLPQERVARPSITF